MPEEVGHDSDDDAWWCIVRRCPVVNGVNASIATLGRADAEAVALASQVARMFYDREMTKVQIAATLGISRYRVARLITLARQRGLVRVELRDIPAQDRDLARSIEDHFGLDLCVVAANAPVGQPEPAPLSRLAAAVVGELIGPGETIGIAWGSTLATVVSELSPRSCPDVHVVQLAGSSRRVELVRNPGELARLLAERLDAAYHPLFAPAFVESQALRDALLREPEIRATAELFGRVSLGLVGVGAYTGGKTSSSSLVQSRTLSDAELAALVDAGAVGDLVLYPFDAEGHFIAEDLTRRAVAITLDQLIAIPRLIAVAGGAHKAEAIVAALRTKAIDILLTDQAAARRMVSSLG